MKRLVFLLFFCISFVTFSQEQTETEQDSIPKPTIFQISSDSIQSIFQEEIKKLLERNDSVKIGVFYSKLNTPFVKIHNKKKRPEDAKFINNKKKVLADLKDKFIPNNDRIKEFLKNMVESREKEIDKIIDSINNRREQNTIDQKKYQEEMFKWLDTKRKVESSIKAEAKDIFKTIDPEYKLELTEREKKMELWTIKKVEIDISEGAINDLRVTLTHPHHIKDRVFTNKATLSVVRFSESFHKKRGRLYQLDDIDNFVYLKDVLGYSPRIGWNYAPNDAQITLEKKEHKILHLNTGLNSILDFRVYSDFLGLINESSNGIINFETSANIPLVTSPQFRIEKLGITFFKDIKPYVNYSRFDNEDRAIKTSFNIDETVTPNDTISIGVQNRLDLIQRSFIRLGTELNLLHLRLAKELPFSFSVPVGMELNMTEVDNLFEESEKFVTNSYRWSWGVRVDVKRFRNFGLHMGVYKSHIDNKLSNESRFERVKSFNILSLYSELYFLDPKDKSSGFFLRLNTNRVQHDSTNFATIQFGYKKGFTFGAAD